MIARRMLLFATAAAALGTHAPRLRASAYASESVSASAFVSISASGAASVSVGAGPEVAVVVSPQTPVENLSLGELQKIARGDRQFWAPGQRITLLIRAPVSHERDVLLRRVYKMSEAQYKQYWVAKVFRNEAPSGPKVVYNNQTAIELLNSLPGCIAFIDASQAPRGLKTVKIDGHLPGDKGYPLQ